MLRPIPENHSIEIELTSKDTKLINNPEKNHTPTEYLDIIWSVLNVFQRHIFPSIFIIANLVFNKNSYNLYWNVIPSVLISLFGLVIWNKFFRDYNDEKINIIARNIRKIYSISHLVLSIAFYALLFSVKLPYQPILIYIFGCATLSFIIAEIYIFYKFINESLFDKYLLKVSNYLIPLTTAIITLLEFLELHSSGKIKTTIETFLFLFVTMKLIEICIHRYASHEIKWKVLLSNIVSSISTLLINRFYLIKELPTIVNYASIYMSIHTLISISSLLTSTSKHKYDLVRVIKLLNGSINYFLLGVYYSIKINREEGYLLSIIWYFLGSILLGFLLDVFEKRLSKHKRLKYYYDYIGPNIVPVLHTIYVFMLATDMINFGIDKILVLLTLNIINIIVFLLMPTLFLLFI